MLARSSSLTEAEIRALRYPLFGSSKLDGIRLRIDPKLGAVSRTHKPIPNEYIHEFLTEYPELYYMDGEVIIGDPTAKDVFNRTQSAVMTSSGAPAFTYFVFDSWAEPRLTYHERLEHACKYVNAVSTTFNGPNRICILPQTVLNTPDEVMAFAEMQTEEGYEGVILRDATAPYKNGRSTLKEQYLLKLKPTEDAEAVVVGFEALRRNNNPIVRDAFGYAKRSSHKANKVDDDLLGKLIVRHPTYGEFAIGSGFDVSTREEIWQNQAKYLGKQVTFTYQLYGSKDKPRIPIFKGFRPELDP
jgi:DNA ligase-1